MGVHEFAARRVETRQHFGIHIFWRIKRHVVHGFRVLGLYALVRNRVLMLFPCWVTQRLGGMNFSVLS